MTAAQDLYESLVNDIFDTVEVLTSLPKNNPEPGLKMWEGHSPRKNPEGRLHSMGIVFPGNLNLLAKFINRLSTVCLPLVGTKSTIAEYLLSFQANKDLIISLFQDILSHPEKGYEHDYKQITTYHSCLLSHTKDIKERAAYIQEHFQKLILCIDSDCGLE